jgi:hypothetical protein
MVVAEGLPPRLRGCVTKLEDPTPGHVIKVHSVICDYQLGMMLCRWSTILNCRDRW